MTVSTPAVLSVDLNALARNYHTLEAVSGQPVHPVVKADGYGLGAQAVATRLMAEGARTFFVARAAEGVRLRAKISAHKVPSGVSEQPMSLDETARGAKNRAMAAHAA